MTQQWTSRVTRLRLKGKKRKNQTGSGRLIEFKSIFLKIVRELRTKNKDKVCEAQLIREDLQRQKGNY